MNQHDIEKIIFYIINKSILLKNKYVGKMKAKIEFCDIFTYDLSEYQQLTNTINEIGKIAYKGPTGNIYSLNKPLETIAGKLQLVKIRIPDKKLHFRGDADFDTEYANLKRLYQNHPKFELIIREKFEMLRLTDPDFDVMVCFSNIPVRKWI